MSLEAGKSYNCFAESAEFGETQKGWLYLELGYRFKDSGDVRKKRHFLVSPEKVLCDSNIPVDPKNPDGPKIPELEVLEKRYGVDLSNFDFDLNKLSDKIVVRAFLGERSWVDKNGQPHKSLEIKSIWPLDGENGAAKPDKSSLMRKYGTVMRAGHAASARTAPAVAKPNAQPPAPSAASAPSAPPAPATVETSTLDECWAAFVKATPEMDEGTRTNEWFALLQSTLGHQKQESATKQEWGKVKAAIGKPSEPDDIPF